MGEILTGDEIQQRFPSEWVLVQNPILDKDLYVLRGRLDFHSPDREAFDRKAIELRLRHSARLYTGRIDPEIAFAL